MGYAGICALLADREDDWFEALAASLALSGDQSPAEAARLMKGVHAFFTPRRETKLARLTAEQQTGWRSLVIGSVGDHLAAACGECGAYAGILARTAQLAGWEVRLVQILDPNETCLHVANELRTTDGWMFVDAMFEVVGQPASGSGVLDAPALAVHWREHPEEATEEYARYGWIPERYRYTNWQAIPLVLPAVRKVLETVKGTRWVDGVSLRTYSLNMHRVRMWLALTISALLVIVPSVVSLRRRRRARARA